LQGKKSSIPQFWEKIYKEARKKGRKEPRKILQKNIYLEGRKAGKKNQLSFIIIYERGYLAIKVRCVVEIRPLHRNRLGKAISG